MPRIQLVALSGLLLLLSPSSAAPADGDAALADAVRAHVAFLADDLLKGRDTGSAEYEIAARYVAARFQALGLEPAGDDASFFQPVPMLKNQLDLESAAVEIHRKREIVDLEWVVDFLMRGDAAREETSVAAPVVFAGFGIYAPQLDYDDFAGVDVRGKIVLELSGAPASFPHNQRAYYSSRRTKRREALKRGAVGLLRLQTAEDARRVPWERITRNPGRPGMRWLDPNGELHDFAPQLEGTAFLSHKGAAKLLVGSGRTLDDILQAASAGRVESFALPVEVTLRRRTSHEKISNSNVAAVLRGSDRLLSNEFVVYTAHLDHVGVGAPHNGDEIYNGAYDNAMGVAILLETARLFADLPEPPKRSVFFLTVTGEEKGLLGSDYFVHHPTVPIETIVANVNLDMPLFLYPLRDVVAFGAEHSSLNGPVLRAAEAVGFDLSPDPIPEEVLFIRSDQYSFVRKGIPAVFLVPGMTSRDPQVEGGKLWRQFLHTHYHMPSDDPSLDFDGPSAARFTRANYLIGLEVASAEDRPTWNEGDFFGDRFGADPAPE